MIAKRYRLKIRFTEPLLGTVAKSETLYSEYIASKVLKRREDGALLSEAAAIALGEEEIETVPESTEKGWTGFHTDQDGPFMYDYQVKGFLKEAANLCKDFPDIKIKALKSKIDNFVYVFPRRLRLPAIETEPLERPLRAMTMQGPRVTLVRSDQIAAGGVLECELRVLPLAGLTEQLLRSLLEFGEYKGLGQWRNGSYGRFVYELEAL